MTFREILDEYNFNWDNGTIIKFKNHYSHLKEGAEKVDKSSPLLDKDLDRNPFANEILWAIDDICTIHVVAISTGISQFEADYDIMHMMHDPNYYIGRAV